MSTQPQPVEGPVPTETPRRRRRSFQPRAILVVALAWCLLWDRISWGNILSGLVVGLVVTLAFPLPSIEFGGRLRVTRLLGLLAHFFWDLTVASIHVAILAFRPSPPRNSVIEVQLRSRSDFYLTLTSLLVGLVPGSTVIEARRSHSIVYLHLLDVSGEEAVRRFHDHVLEIEERVVRVLGSPEEIAAVEQLKKEGR
ncbi:Na+/H+ antiporter subunit E [Intrasporangium sp.]|jgi:multicomponent Na+:H+ antiporter subunit E|uniref:Na+/H+ antiporter subunit E n=1 Tax=Intrasporangium sp. TaxID=1925024 RepID=UPI0033657558